MKAEYRGWGGWGEVGSAGVLFYVHCSVILPDEMTCVPRPKGSEGASWQISGGRVLQEVERASAKTLR